MDVQCTFNSKGTCIIHDIKLREDFNWSPSSCTKLGETVKILSFIYTIALHILLAMDIKRLTCTSFLHRQQHIWLSCYSQCANTNRGFLGVQTLPGYSALVLTMVIRLSHIPFQFRKNSFNCIASLPLCKYWEDSTINLQKKHSMDLFTTVHDIRGSIPWMLMSMYRHKCI